MQGPRAKIPWGVVLTIVLAFIVFLPHLGANLAEDDEGAYLFASWRLASGEALFDDIPSSKPPLPFYVGAGLLRVFGHDPLPLRLLSAMLLALAAGALYAGARRLDTIRASWIVPVIFVMHPDAYMQGRFFRPDAYMLFFATLGLVLALLAARDGARSTRLALWSGLAFGLALICKFNAVIPLAIAATLLASERRYRALAWTCGLALGLGATLFAVFELATDASLVELTLGHHLKQDSAVHASMKVKAFLREHAPIFMVCFATLLKRPGRFPRETRLLRVLAFATAASFLLFFLVGRDVFMRHFVYAAPCFALLAPPAIEAAAERVRSGLLPAAWARVPGEKTLVLLGLLFALGVTWEWSAIRAWRGEHAGFRQLASGLDEALGPEDRLLADYAMINFLTRRPGLPASSQLSQGAILAGQIDARRLVGEIDAAGARAVLIHTSGIFGFRYGVRDKVLAPSHLASLPDLGLFRREIAARMELAATVACGELVFELWMRDPPARDLSWTAPCRSLEPEGARGDAPGPAG